MAATLPPRGTYAYPDVLQHGMWVLGATNEHRARILCLIFLSSYLVVDGGSAHRCYIRYLPSLTDLGTVKDYDWAGLGYAQLLIGMRRACRVKRDSSIPSCQGIWRVIEAILLLLNLLHIYFIHSTLFDLSLSRSSGHTSTFQDSSRNVLELGPSLL